MSIQMGKVSLEMGSRYLTELQDSNAILHDTAALRKRLEDDGYLLIRGFHDRKKVLEARTGLLRKLDKQARLDHSYPLEEGVIAEGAKGTMFGGPAQPDDEDMRPFYELVTGQAVMEFFDRLLGGESMTYDYKWPRAVGQGGNTGAHYDIVYMGRGTKQVYTMWTPLGDIPIEQGTLTVCLGSHRFEQMKQTYGQVDVDRDQHENGWFSTDPIEMVDRFGGQWATTSFSAGDVMIFGMYLLHGSTDNMTNRFRLSADTRYQLKSEPVDERWVGKQPKGHYAWGKGQMKTMEEARREWNL
ncbi:phytanoyl-CoA dioxygenase [Paenibacillus sp. H1-7]|uniref:phytanoyl-CoA dioxygenase family protein n=1 Tax=Paenibacillus sp. H1-7 TaxID=2282849 RepID=UPI001EF85591|nr:phytanoyl-CoA dioxygenase family protein [Paenibacillus sp. H1-7]ULL18406.1 phytanoyl-CoA dioxygenase [Paenibacillus sp. H1-7]